MPTYNRGPTLIHSIPSVLAQLYEDFELVIYDDGSNEEDGFGVVKGSMIRIGPDTSTVLKKFRDPRIRYHKERVNVGIAAARNRLIDLAKGEYLVWLDSDDRANVWRLAVQVAVMDSMGASYCRSSTTTFAKPGDVMWKLPPLLVWRGGVSVATIMFRQESKTRYDEQFHYVCEDMDWECRYAADNGRGVHVPLTLYAIGRRSPDRLSMRHKEAQYETEITEDKKRLERKRTAAIAKMKAAGYEKMPHRPPWEFMEGFISKWYRGEK
uniref:Putative glycosyltransferase n=1 Tax=viral metagenome TaxID=1070528 RepID=A0A6M3IPB8_9ZZZZ